MLATGESEARRRRREGGRGATLVGEEREGSAGVVEIEEGRRRLGERGNFKI